jgi:histone H3/H4
MSKTQQHQQQKQKSKNTAASTGGIKKRLISKAVAKSKAANKISSKKATVEDKSKAVIVRHSHPGTVARRNVIKYQKSTDGLIASSPIEELIRNVASELGHSDCMIEKGVVKLIAENVEWNLVRFFHACNQIAGYANRKTVSTKEMKLLDFLLNQNI